MCSCVQVINRMKVVRARKEYSDSCREYIEESLEYLRQRKSDYNLSIKEWRTIIGSRQNGWRIKKGELYEHSVLKMDGEIYQWKSKCGLTDICNKYDLFPEC